MINVPLLEVVRGGGICKPPDSSLYGGVDFPCIYGAHWSTRRNTLVTQPQAHREIFLSDLSGSIRREGPLTLEYGDERVDTVLMTGCELILTNIVLGHGTQGCVGACNGAQQYAMEQRGARWCIVVCSVAPSCQRSSSHHNTLPHRVTETCASTSVGIDGILHEQGIPCIVEAVFQWVSKLQTLY